MAEAQKISATMVALPERDYQTLYAAANDSYSHWVQAQEYKRELTDARATLEKAGTPDQTIDALCAQLLESRRANKALFALLLIASVFGLALGVTR